MSIGEEIRRARLRAGVSQASLARRAGTSQAAISRIERGLESPTWERIEQILAGLGLKPGLTLERIADVEAEPRRLLELSRRTPQERFDEGLEWADFVRELEVAGAAARRG